MTFTSCQTTQPLTTSESINPKRYNWHQRQLHPSFGITNRDSIQGTTITFKISTTDFTADIPSFLDVHLHTMVQDSAVLFQKRFQLEMQNTASPGVWQGEISIPPSAARLNDIVLKFGPNNLGDQYYLNWPLGNNGWTAENYIHTNIVHVGTTIVKSGKGKFLFAPLSEKLPSPPFSTNPPFIPETQQPIEGDSIIAQNGAYIFIDDDAKQSPQIITAVDPMTHPNYPEWVTTKELAAPMRYLCSKEEFESISKSTEGPENNMEKFWIQSAGGRDKARGLIKTYYQRVWDANHYFTSYAEGWKTDRGMIYLIFGHPEKIELENNLEIWTYTLETGELLFAFEKQLHPLWGEIFVLRRNEQY